MTTKLFKTDKELQDAVDTYFVDVDDKPTLTGLALHLGFCDRQSIYDYEKNEVHSCTIKRARLRVEAEYEKKLHGASNAGPIFALKNFGWTDKTEVEQYGKDGKPIEHKWIIETVSADAKDPNP